MADIKVEALRHVYSEGTPFERVAIEDISVEIPAGQFMGIIGHTGSGKSTFIQHLNGLLQPSAGTVTLGGQNIFETKKITHNIRFRVGLVFQYPEYQLFEETVYKDISFGPKNMGLDEKEIDAHVRRAAAFTGISENLFEDSPLELSGGQKRRVAIAGVIAMEPEVLILDEPTAGLDPEGCRQILENICTYKRETGATVILVSHSMDDMAKLADRLVVFNQGHIAMDGTPKEIFSHPEDLFSIGLSVPESTKIALELKHRGVDLGGPVYTDDQLVEAVLRYDRRAKA